jgi:lysophospholipase L1-like esterase
VKKIKILFQGDSITDAGRDKRNYHDVGQGYPKYASEALTESFPEVDFEFINFGISGNRTSQLFDRLYKDGIAFQPDVDSVLIGINDIWHRYGGDRIATTDEQFALNYRCILERLKKETNAKIVMLAPFLLDAEPYEGMRADLERMLPIVQELAKEFADVYVPLNEYFEEALKTQPEPLYYSKDGVHPNDNGRMFIGKIYAEAVAPLVKQF